VCIQYLYSGDTTVCPDNALPLLHISRMYVIPDLGKTIVDYLKNHMTDQMAIPVYASLGLYDDKSSKDLTNMALEHICKYVIREIRSARMWLCDAGYNIFVGFKGTL
jgi:hypothetical protein